MKDVIIYHNHCNDGKVAAAIMQKYLKGEAHLHAANYPDPVPKFDFACGTAFVVDFSYNNAKLLELAEEFIHVIIIDHHASAIEELNSMLDIPHNVHLLLDESISGALATWNYCFPKVEAPELVKDVSDRDLWQFKRRNSKLTNLVVKCVDIPSLLHSQLLESSTDGIESFRLAGFYEEAVSVGTSMRRYEDKVDHDIAETATNITLLGFEAKIVNCFPGNTSNVSDILNKQDGCSLVISYQIIGDDVHLSFRGINKEGKAKQCGEYFGGGGHY